MCGTVASPPLSCLSALFTAGPIIQSEHAVIYCQIAMHLHGYLHLNVDNHSPCPVNRAAGVCVCVCVCVCACVCVCVCVHMCVCVFLVYY